MAYSGFIQTRGIWNPIITLYSKGTSEKFKVGESFSRLLWYTLFIKGKMQGKLYVLPTVIFPRRVWFMNKNTKYEMAASYGLLPRWKITKDGKPFLFLKNKMYKEKKGWIIDILNARENKIGAITIGFGFTSSPFSISFDNTSQKLLPIEMLGIMTGFAR